MSFSSEILQHHKNERNFAVMSRLYDRFYSKRRPSNEIGACGRLTAIFDIFVNIPTWPGFQFTECVTQRICHYAAV